MPVLVLAGVGNLVRSSTPLPQPGPGHGYPIPSKIQHAVDRIRRVRYASCDHAGGLSCLSDNMGSVVIANTDTGMIPILIQIFF